MAFLALDRRDFWWPPLFLWRVPTFTALSIIEKASAISPSTGLMSSSDAPSFFFKPSRAKNTWKYYKREKPTTRRCYKWVQLQEDWNWLIGLTTHASALMKVLKKPNDCQITNACYQFYRLPHLLHKNQWDSDVGYGRLLAQQTFKSWKCKCNRRIPSPRALAEAEVEANEEYDKNHWWHFLGTQ